MAALAPLVAAFAVFAPSARADTWVDVTLTGRDMYSVETDGLVSKESRRQFWVRVAKHTGRVRMVMQFHDVDCENQKDTIKDYIEYDIGGNVVLRRNGDYQIRVVPGSIGSRIAAFVCNGTVVDNATTSADNAATSSSNWADNVSEPSGPDHWELVFGAERAALFLNLTSITTPQKNIRLAEAEYVDPRHRDRLVIRVSCAGRSISVTGAMSVDPKGQEVPGRILSLFSRTLMRAGSVSAPIHRSVSALQSGACTRGAVEPGPADAKH